MQKSDADFYVLAGHKMYGPSGIGVLYSKKELLESMTPYQGGGHMIKTVNYNSATWADLPHKFEAGTGNIEGVVGLNVAVKFMDKIGWKAIVAHEKQLTSYCLQQVSKIPGLTIYGPKSAADRIGVISFNIAGVPPHDLASILDERGIAIRTGHHCAMPLCQKLGIESSARISLAVYNTKSDIDEFIAGMNYATKLLR